jgi:hypothetical protein
MRQLIALVFALVLAAPALAQDVWSFTPNTLPISDRQIEALTEDLALDADQQAVIDDLLGALRVRHRQAWVAFAESRSDAQHAMNASRDYGAQQTKLTDLAAAFNDEQKSVVETFFNDVRLILTPEQEKAWPRVEIDRRRTATLVQYASYNDEAIDLVAIVDALDISDDTRADLAPILDRYVQTLDPILDARNRKLEALGAKLRDIEKLRAKTMSPGPEFDEEMMRAYQEIEEQGRKVIPDALEARRACARVRDVNREFKREVEEHLPPGALEDWNKATTFDLNQNRFPWMNQSRAENMFNTLENLDQMRNTFEMQASMYENSGMGEYVSLIRAVEPMSPSQLDQLERIKERHESRIDRLERENKPAARHDDEDPSFIQVRTPDGTLTLTRIAEDANQMGGFWPGMPNDDPELAKKRNEIEQQTIDEIRDILTINQRAIVAYQ